MCTKRNVTKFINNHFSESSYQSYFTENGYKNFRAYLGNVLKGNQDIYTTPFAKGESMEDILNQWADILVSIQNEYPSLMEFENELRGKVGPLSVQKPLMDRMEDIAHYWWDISLPAKPVLPEAIKATMQEFSKIKGMRPRSQARTVDLMKKSTNSGAPLFTKRRNVVLDSYPVTVITDQGRHPDVYLIYNGPWGEGSRSRDKLTKPVGWSTAAVIGWRGQEGGASADDVKQRVIWMFPFSVNIAELQVYQPFIELCQKFNLVPAWVSMDKVDEEITRLFDTKNEDDLIVCTDFSKFDQHFNEVMADTAKTVLNFILSNDRRSKQWLTNVFPAKYFIPLAWEAEHGNVTVFAQARHGMASGSGGTNADETLTHRCLQHEAAILNGEKLNVHSMCLGDDGILTFPGITVDKVVEAYESHGQECNKEKQYASSQDCVYLRRWHSTHYRRDGICVGVYSSFRALGRMRYLERWMDPEVWTPEMVNLRYLSILENCKWHPLFHELVEFCMKRDRYRLGLDIPHFFDRIESLAKEATDYMPEFLGYTKTLQGEGPKGISNWEVVKYLKSKA